MWMPNVKQTASSFVRNRTLQVRKRAAETTTKMKSKLKMKTQVTHYATFVLTQSGNDIDNGRESSRWPIPLKQTGHPLGYGTWFFGEADPGLRGDLAI